MVPPAMMTALDSFSTWAKWIAGFNSRNLVLLSDKVPRIKTNLVFLKHLLSSQFFILRCAFQIGTLSMHHHSAISVAGAESLKESLHLHHGRCRQHSLCPYRPLLVTGRHCRQKINHE